MKGLIVFSLLIACCLAAPLSSDSTKVKSDGKTEAIIEAKADGQADAKDDKHEVIYVTEDNKESEVSPDTRGLFRKKQNVDLTTVEATTVVVILAKPESQGTGLFHKKKN